MNAGVDLSQWEWTCACCGKRKRGVPDYGFACTYYPSVAMPAASAVMAIAGAA